MPRERLIKPKFFKSEQVAALDFPSRLLFQSMWCQADRNGCLRHNVKILKAETFPYDDQITAAKVAKMIDHMAELALIKLYQVDGVTYCYLTGFFKNQKVHPKEPAAHPLPPTEPVQESEKKPSCNLQETFLPLSNPTLPSLPSLPAIPSLPAMPTGATAPEARAGGGDTPQTILSEWNAVAKIDGVRLEEATKLTDKRRASAKERLTDPYFRENWRQALQRIREDKFYQGCGERGWVAGLDYFLRPDTVAKVMERKRGGIMAYPDGVFVGDFDGFEDGNTANISDRNGAGEKNTGEAIPRPQVETKTAYKPISGATVAA